MMFEIINLLAIGLSVASGIIALTDFYKRRQAPGKWRFFILLVVCLVTFFNVLSG